MRDFGKMFSFTRPAEASATIPDTPAGSAEEHRIYLQMRPTLWGDLANAVWAIQQKCCGIGSTDFKDEYRPIARHVDRLSECLTEVGLEVQSHTNHIFDSGQSLEVIAFQPTQGIAKDIVIETIRPTIYLKGVRIQMGQVIVATPQAPQGDVPNV